MENKFNKRSLIIMSLGNIIGSGIFLGSSNVIAIAGPSAVFAYLLGGLIMAFEVMYITEMCVINPTPGAFRVHATEIFGPWMGFVNGWMFWCSGVLGMASEVAAAAIFTRYWLPHIPLWVFCVLYTVLMTVINFNDLRNLSKIESFLASVKVIALVLFILLGFSILLKIVPLEQANPTNPFSSLSALFPHGFKGVYSVMIMVMFSYTGTGIIGLAIADTERPEKNAPVAISVIVLSVLTLFILTVFFIVWLTPWNSLSPDVSPLVVILNRLHLPYSDSILNFIVLTAALSGLNSSMYSSSRMMNSLSRDGQAPKIFLKTNKNGVPMLALGISSLALLFTAILSYFLPDKVFVILATASGFLALLNWLTITATNYFYRKKTLREQPEKLKYKALFYPVSNVVVFLLIATILVLGLFTGESVSLFLCVLFIIGLLILYFTLKKMGKLK